MTEHFNMVFTGSSSPFSTWQLYSIFNFYSMVSSHKRIFVKYVPGVNSNIQTSLYAPQRSRRTFEFIFEVLCLPISPHTSRLPTWLLTWVLCLSVYFHTMHFSTWHVFKFESLCSCVPMFLHSVLHSWLIHCARRDSSLTSLHCCLLVQHINMSHLLTRWWA